MYFELSFCVQFIEGGTEQKDTTSSDDEELEDQEHTHIEATDDSVAENIDFLDLEDQVPANLTNFEVANCTSFNDFNFNNHHELLYLYTQ